MSWPCGQRARLTDVARADLWVTAQQQMISKTTYALDTLLWSLLLYKECQFKKLITFEFLSTGRESDSGNKTGHMIGFHFAESNPMNIFH